MEWINLKHKKPEYKQDVIVCRPNRYSGKNDILIARLYQAKEGGTEYGRGDGMGGYPKTYNDYWGLPAIVLLETITYWMPLPEEPCEGKNVEASDSNCTIHGVIGTLPSAKKIAKDLSTELDKIDWPDNS